MSFENIPLEMHALRQFVVWRYETPEPGKPQTKVPYNPTTGKLASVIAPQTWCSFEEVTAAAKDATKWAGIGFVFSSRDHYCGIDLDNPAALHPDGTPKFDDAKRADIVKQQQFIFEKFVSYAEHSPSGTGLHIIIRGSVPSGRKHEAVEIYSNARFFTMTGNVYRNAPINDHNAMANRLWEKMASPRSKNADGFTSDPNQTYDDAAITDMAKGAKNGDKFIALYNGEWEKFYPSQSEADFALIDIISFYTQHVPQVVRIFRTSQLGRRDKAARDTYVMPMVRRSFDNRPVIIVRGGENGEPLQYIVNGMDIGPIIATCRPVAPVDLWAKFDPPELPTGLLSPIIEQFARSHSELMGADAAGLAMSAVAVCAAAIPDHVQVKVKRHGDWTESPRLWVMPVGLPSTQKTPIMNEAAKPLLAIDRAWSQQYCKELADFEALDKDDKKAKPKPIHSRKVIMDITSEKAAEILAYNPHGILSLQDELSGFIGGLDKYSNGGGGKDRGFWLQSYNGGYQTIDRKVSGSIAIENVSVSMLGGIQPAKIRELAGKTFDDGLLQRYIPIILKSAGEGKDEPTHDINSHYSRLINTLVYSLPPTMLHFDDEAQCIRRELEKRHNHLQVLENLNAKLAAHIGKYNGIFARLCIVWHCIENTPIVGNLPTTITGDTARRVAAFLHEFLLPHAFSFYMGVLGFSDDYDALAATAGYILTRPELTELKFRDLKRGRSAMKALDHFEANKLFEKLEYLGWVFRIPGSRSRFQINPEVHRLFAQRAERERERTEQTKQIMAEAFKTRREG